MHSLIPRIF